MHGIYRLRADELDQRFLDSVRSQFQGPEIEIAVREAVEIAGEPAVPDFGGEAGDEREPWG